MALDELTLIVEVVYSPSAGIVAEERLQLVAGATVAHAIQTSQLVQRYPEVAQAPCAIWGRLCERHEVLRHQDRVEIFRPLKVDPKQARRQRYARQVEQHGRRPRTSA